MTDVKTTPTQFVGIDVAKDSLAVCVMSATDPRTVKNWACDNTRSAIRAVIKKLDPNAFLVCEPTGGYEALLLEEALSTQITCHRADTLKAKAFARSFGHLAKTDAIDARLLAHYGAERWSRLALYQPTDKDQAELSNLMARRQDLLAMKMAESNRAKTPGSGAIESSIKKHITHLQSQLDQIDQKIADVIERSSQLKERIELYQSVDGVGPRTAAAMMALMPELGHLNRRQAASLAGLAPHPNDSGTFKGYRRMRGGRPNIRSNLFMAALAARRTKGNLGIFYQRLINNGKPKLVALHALMRKIIVILNAKARDTLKTMS